MYDNKEINDADGYYKEHLALRYDYHIQKLICAANDIRKDIPLKSALTNNVKNLLNSNKISEEKKSELAIELLKIDIKLGNEQAIMNCLEKIEKQFHPFTSPL